MKLYCVRHGEAESPEIDALRPLTPQGKEEIQKLAVHLSRLPLKIQQLFHSDKLRAVQTAEIIAKELRIEKVISAPKILSEDSTIQPIEEMLAAEQENTMLVGHLPFMYKLINSLLLHEENHYPLINFFPGTIVCLERDQQWLINWILHPRLLSGVDK